MGDTEMVYESATIRSASIPAGLLAGLMFDERNVAAATFFLDSTHRRNTTTIIGLPRVVSATSAGTRHLALLRRGSRVTLLRISDLEVAAGQKTVADDSRFGITEGNLRPIMLTDFHPEGVSAGLSLDIPIPQRCSTPSTTATAADTLAAKGVSVQYSSALLEGYVGTRSPHQVAGFVIIDGVPLAVITRHHLNTQPRLGLRLMEGDLDRRHLLGSRYIG